MKEKAGMTTNPPWGLFPPYGFMEQDAMGVVTDPKPPKAWLGDLASYEKWLADTLKMIQDLIWPVFDRKTLTWRGASVAWMKELTEFDLTLLRKLYTAQPDPIDLPMTAPIGLPPLKSHRELFGDEDLQVSHWGSALRHYDKNWDDAQVQELKALILAAYFTKVGNSVLRLKLALQRPRPYQTAMLLGFNDFTYYEALSADTPSMVCGHCAQALLLIGAVMERLILSGTQISADRWTALEQLAVDIGDRRVLARVHYPSDALASWLMVLSIADHVFATPEVKKHLRIAITRRSAIYKLIRGTGGLYRTALAAI